MTNIPQDIVDDAKEAGFVFQEDMLGLYFGRAILDMSNCLTKFAKLRDERQRSSGEAVGIIKAETRFEDSAVVHYAHLYQHLPIGTKLFTTPQQPNIPAEGKKAHNWDRDGERCLDCGDKDWMADAHCSASPSAPVATQSQAFFKIDNDKVKVAVLEKLPYQATGYQIIDATIDVIRALITDTQAKDGE
jgi:hypothetical protein